MTIKEELQRIEEQKEMIIQKLYNKIQSLPQNNIIKNYRKLDNGGTMFTINVSEIIGKPWNPQHYDFKKQYEGIINDLESSSKPIDRLVDIIENNVYVLRIGTNQFRYRINVKVREYLINEIVPLILTEDEIESKFPKRKKNKYFN